MYHGCAGRQGGLDVRRGDTGSALGTRTARTSYLRCCASGVMIYSSQSLLLEVKVPLWGAMWEWDEGPEEEYDAFYIPCNVCKQDNKKEFKYVKFIVIIVLNYRYLRGNCMGV